MVELIIAAVILLAYMVYILARFGVPRSLSDTYYLLEGEGWVFQVVLALFIMLILPLWINISSSRTECLAFLSCASLGFVAAAARFKEILTETVHYVSAGICCVCAVLWQVLECSWMLPCICLLLAGVCSVIRWNKWCWWLEVAIVASTLVSLWMAV